MKLTSINLKISTLCIYLMSAVFVGCGGGKASISVLPSQEPHEQARRQSKKIDILFVIDDSGSMRPVQQRLRDNFPKFVEKLYAQGFDFRVAVAKTSAYYTESKAQTDGLITKYYEAGRTVAEFRCGHGNNCGDTSERGQTYGRSCKPSNETTDYGSTPTTNGNGTPAVGTDHILSSSDFADAAAMAVKFSRNADVGLCGSGDERALESAETVLRAMSSVYTDPAHKFPREDAHFAVIHVGDEPDGRWSSAGTSNAKGSLSDHYLPDISKATAGDTAANRNVVKEYLSALQAHEPSSTVSVHAIQYLVGAGECPSARDTYVGHAQIYMADIATGKKISICNDFADELASLGDHIVSLATEFHLNAVDILEHTLHVYVDGDKVNRVAEEDAATETEGFVLRRDPYRVSFLSGSIPPEGASIEVEFTGRYLPSPIRK